MKPIPAAVRRAVLARDDEACVLCGRPSHEIAHLKSRGAGGPSTPNNLAILCHLHHMETHARPEAQDAFRAECARRGILP